MSITVVRLSYHSSRSSWRAYDSRYPQPVQRYVTTFHIRVPDKMTVPVSKLRSGCPCTQTVTSLRSRYSSGINPRSIGSPHFGQVGAVEGYSRWVAPVTARCTCVPQSGQKSASAGSGCLHIAHSVMGIVLFRYKLISRLAFCYRAAFDLLQPMLLCYGNHVNPLNSFSKSANSLKAHMCDEQPPSLNHESLGLSNGQLLDGLRAMIRARAVDDRLWLLSRQGKA